MWFWFISLSPHDFVSIVLIFLKVLEKEGQLLRMEPSQDGIRAIVRSVSTCLGCFHACNIVHGDVKVTCHHRTARLPSTECVTHDLRRATSCVWVAVLFLLTSMQSPA